MVEGEKDTVSDRRGLTLYNVRLAVAVLHLRFKHNTTIRDQTRLPKLRGWVFEPCE